MYQIHASKIIAGDITATAPAIVALPLTQPGHVTAGTSISLGTSRLDFDGDQLRFHGDADEAARIFIDQVIALYSDDVRRLKALESGSRP